MGTLAAENLDVCTACDWWDSNIQLTMGIDPRRQIYPPWSKQTMTGRMDDRMDGRMDEMMLHDILYHM
jgi:hypothetical protein